VPGSMPVYGRQERSFPADRLRGHRDRKAEGKPYMTTVELDVQDGSNFFDILVRDDERPLPGMKHLVAHVEQVAKKLVPRFYANA